ncbi:MAG: gamma-glutamyltransferase family protein, partial [Actinomycetota bacterium]|nr:gamma-glutamyltransferase family protein [Actinomycetota bacterium]
HRVPALTVDVDDWVYATVPPPGIGGPVLAAMLLLMGGRPRGDWTPDDRAHLARVQGAVLRHRATHLDVAGDRVSAGQRLLDDVRRQGSAWLRTSPSTVHVSCVDGEGMACAVTASSGYGSGVVTPGTGLMLNNCLGEPELNRPGLHAWRPGDRLPSNMAPTVGRRADGAVLAIGSPGADRITTALVQVLAALGGGVGLQEAVDAPRLHVRPVRGGGLEVDHEADAELPLPTSGGEPLVAREMPPHSMYFGGVAAAMRHPDGTLEAAADPRRAGAVVLVD